MIKREFVSWWRLQHMRGFIPAKEKTTTKNFIKKFGYDLNNELKNTNGNINSIPLIYYDREVINGHPIYNDSNIEGLKIMMNDTEYSKIHRQSYHFDSITKEWEGTFYIEVFDHFGLDDEDLIKFQNTTLPFTLNDTTGKGFASWWLLQHHKGRIPFRTQMKFIVTLKGKI